MSGAAATPQTSSANLQISHPSSGLSLLQRKCACGSPKSTLAENCQDCQSRSLQTRLIVGDSNDPLEREADQVAGAVIRARTTAGKAVGPISRLVQRTNASAGKASGADTRTAPPLVESVLASAGRPLDPSARAFFEPRFGHDFGSVRIHADGSAAASARAVDAHAYTVGGHVVFGHGRYAPDRAEGRWLLAHELAHVVQQGPVIRRNSISPPLRSVTESDEDKKEPKDDKGEDSMQRLQRVPAIVGLDDAGPKADLSGQRDNELLYQLAECEKQKGPDPNECKPTTPPGWTDFNATPQMASPFAAVTASRINDVKAPSQECWVSITGHAGPPRQFQGVFTSGLSWVKPRPRDAGDPTKNGSAAIISKCQSAFDAASAKNMINVTWNLSTAPDATCPASVRPAGTKATTRAACSTVVATDFNNTEIAESARLLNHEQTHFKLTCALAKKANGLLWGGVSFGTINAVIQARLSAAQGLYDTESQHGCNAAGQAKWQTEIANGLPSVKLP
jgi:hypothetical protein